MDQQNLIEFSPMTAKETVEAYLKLKDEATQLDAEYKAAKGEIDARLDSLLAHAAELLKDQGQESANCGVGKMFFKTGASVKVEDMDAFFDFVKEDNSDFLTKVARKEAVMKYLDENGVEPPGIKVERFRKVHITR